MTVIGDVSKSMPSSVSGGGQDASFTGSSESAQKRDDGFAASAQAVIPGVTIGHSYPLAQAQTTAVQSSAVAPEVDAGFRALPPAKAIADLVSRKRIDPSRINAAAYNEHGVIVTVRGKTTQDTTVYFGAPGKPLEQVKAPLSFMSRAGDISVDESGQSFFDLKPWGRIVPGISGGIPIGLARTLPASQTAAVPVLKGAIAIPVAGYGPRSERAFGLEQLETAAAFIKEAASSPATSDWAKELEPYAALQKKVEALSQYQSKQ